jgi:hypothetical protein
LKGSMRVYGVEFAPAVDGLAEVGELGFFARCARRFVGAAGGGAAGAVTAAGGLAGVGAGLEEKIPMSRTPTRTPAAKSRNRPRPRPLVRCAPVAPAESAGGAVGFGGLE